MAALTVAACVAAVEPQDVASVTGVGGTYRGSKVADDIQSNSISRTAFSILGQDIIGPLMTWAQANPGHSVKL